MTEPFNGQPHKIVKHTQTIRKKFKKWGFKKYTDVLLK